MAAMKNTATSSKSALKRNLLAAALLTVAALGDANAALVSLPATADGDAQYAWNSKYGPSGYTTGVTTIGVGLSLGGQYGNDYTMGIVEIPIAPLRGGILTSATLNVYSEGFGTGYYYGSAGMRWLDVGAVVPTGNPMTDGLGPILGSPSIEYGLWDSSTGQGPGWFAFDVSAHVQADLDAGRDYSTYVLNGSRETGGSIRVAEFGGGFTPSIDAISTVPEPSSLVMLGLGVGLLGSLRRRRSDFGHAAGAVEMQPLS